MKNRLKDQYERRQLVEKLKKISVPIINEDISDYFKSGSDNIKKFNNSLAQIKQLTDKYNLQNLSKAIANAEQKFENSIANQAAGQKPDQGKAQILSSVTSFVTIMSSFLKTLGAITSQLPSLKNNQNGNQPLKTALGGDAGKFAALISNQFSKAGGGAMQTLTRFFKGGGGQNAQQVLNFFGLNANAVAQDMMNMTGQQFQEFVTAGNSTQPPQLENPQQPTTSTAKPTEKTTSAAKPQEAEPTQQTQGTAPTQAAQTTTSQKPKPEDVAQRDVAIQKAVRNRNAFNTQALGGLSNQEIATDMHNLAKALGIKL